MIQYFAFSTPAFSVAKFTVLRQPVYCLDYVLLSCLTQPYAQHVMLVSDIHAGTPCLPPILSCTAEAIDAFLSSALKKILLTAGKM